MGEAMPLPMPKPEEKEGAFVSRFMSNAAMKEDYPEQEKRLGVAYSQWNKAKGIKKSDDDGFSIECTFAKADDELRTVWGWASVVTEDHKPVVDSQGDVMTVQDLQKAAHDFMAFYRTGGEMHQEMGIGTVVDSIVLSKSVQDALGIDLGREGWFVGMKVDKDDVWKRVKSGEYAGFSIGGSGVRKDLEE